MVSEVVRANFGSYPTPALGSAHGRAGTLVQRFAPANDSLVLDNDLIADTGRQSRRAWTGRVRDEAVSLEDLVPRAAFAAQLMSQEDVGTRAHVEDFAGMIAAYTTAEQRPSRATTGSTLSFEI